MHSRWKVLAAVAVLGAAAGCAPVPDPGTTPETRIVSYLEESIEEGRVVDVSTLVNDVFTTPEERAALDRLYDTFFKVPMFLVQYQAGTGELPTLVQIAEQFRFEGPETASVILSLMESDPRLPRFFERNAEGEIVSLDVEPVLDHPQFGEQIERSIAGWDGRAIPAFTAETFDGGQITSAGLAGRPYMVYVWFSNCPPCVETGPLLVELHQEYRDQGFEIVALNADAYLELPYDPQVPIDYAAGLGMDFVLAHLSAGTAEALGGVSIFPTMFFVDRVGTVMRHFVNFQEKEDLEAAVEATLSPGV
jgi:thiol-disulfide isomerase/thioredoxin